jgi:hypothetical protein
MKIASITAACMLAFIGPLAAQEDFPEPPDFSGGPPPGGLMAEKREILTQFDKDNDKHLNREERAAARAFLKENPAAQRGGGPPGGMRGPGGFGPMGGRNSPPVPGQKLAPADVKPAAAADLFDAKTLRTLFLDFDNSDWEAELEAFHSTDVDVPAKLTVDGKTYSGVGIRFRGMSSYMMVGAGHKRSLNVSIDHTNKNQRLGGVRTLNLLNSNGDGSFLSAVLFSHLARKHLPAPKANLVRVVINGEDWGVYVNQEQFNKDFVKATYGTEKGARWKVRGSPNGQGGLDYIDDDIASYQRRYEMKNGNDDDWHALIRLCKTLCKTPAEELEAKLKTILDVEGALWFLALDCTLINSDGYWTRASDYSIYRDPQGKFHVFPCDMNEAFREAEGGPPGGGPPGGPGGRRPDRPSNRGEADPAAADRQPRAFPFPPAGGLFGIPPRTEGVKLDPLVALNDANKPLRSKLLAVPALRARYLADVRTLAEEDLAWKNLGPVVAGFRSLIKQEVAADTRKLSTTEEFLKLTADDAAAPAAAEPREMRRGPGHGGMALRAFADQRREFLLADPRVQGPKAAD